MKKLILISALLLTINGCGPSQKDKDIAAAACSEIMETFKSEEAKRLKIYNDARLELGMRPITSSDSKLFFDISVKYGGFDACMDQFFPKPPTPPTKAELEAQEEARKVAEEAEAARALAKKAEEAEAARKAEEERQYIAENTKTSYLSCPRLAQIKRRECISCE